MQCYKWYVKADSFRYSIFSSSINKNELNNTYEKYDGWTVKNISDSQTKY